jgi:small nuclear ribonucleoprotein (snRNP)-like protein
MYTYNFKEDMEELIRDYEEYNKIKFDWTKPMIKALVELFDNSIYWAVRNQFDESMTILLQMPTEEGDFKGPIHMKCILSNCNNRALEAYPDFRKVWGDLEKTAELEKALKTPPYRYCEPHIKEFQELGLLKTNVEIPEDPYGYDEVIKNK